MASEFAIEAHALTKRYGDQLVVDRLNLQIPIGQCYGLLGPNGAGKSTTIHMLTTMTSPSYGEAWVATHAISSQPVDVRRAVGLVFQDSALDRSMTIAENLQFAAALYGLSKIHANQRIEFLLSIFNLQNLQHRKLLTLSGGQRRAVDIVRGVLHSPSVLFLDEPTIGLDLPSRRAIWRFIEQLREEQKLTVFLTTHYLEEAINCDRVDFIQQGQLQTGGHPQVLIDALAHYVLELESADPEAVRAQCEPILGAALQEGNQLSFLIKTSTLNFQQLQKQLGEHVTAFRWRKPNLNDVYLWHIGLQRQESPCLG